MKLENGSCVSGKAFHTGASPHLFSLPLFPSFSSTKDASRFKKKQQASRPSRFFRRVLLVFFSRCTTPTGSCLLAKENPRTDASFSPRDLSSSRFFPPSHSVGSSRQVNAKVAVRCKSWAFPPWFALLEYLSRESIVVPSPQSPPATITKGARVNIDNDGVLVFVRSRVSGASIATDRIHRSFGTSELYRTLYHLSYIELWLRLLILFQFSYAKIKIYSLIGRNESQIDNSLKYFFRNISNFSD